MFGIRCAKEEDRPFWVSLDRQLAPDEFTRKVRDRRGYVISEDGRSVGVMRYNLIWDVIPFLTLILLADSARGKGYGKQALLFWEEEMRAKGHKMVMTSTQVNEEAQHFYRKLGYQERGALFLDATPWAQPQEMFMVKAL